MSRTALAADEIIELGQAQAEAAPEEALAEVRGIIDSWLQRYSKEVTGIIARQSRLAAGESVLGTWARELAAAGALATTGGALSALLTRLDQLDDTEQWEATRHLAFRLLNESQKFAQQYGSFFTDEQLKLGNMEDRQLLSAIDEAEQFAKAIRPEFIDSVNAFENGVVQVFVDVARQLGEVLKKIGLTALAIPSAAFNLAQWLKDHLVTILAVGGVAAAATVALVLYATLKPAAEAARRAA